MSFNIKEVGLGLQMAGMLMTSAGKAYIVSYPDESDVSKKTLEVITPTEEEYEAIIKQMDIQETEIFDANKKAIAIVRKSQRQLDQNIVWQVFRRDSFICRYCGANTVPMTYDHVDLWEQGGDTTLQNGICSCRKCNKTRANMEYKDWLQSEYYLEVSKNLEEGVKNLNEIVGKIYTKFPKKISGRKR